MQYLVGAAITVVFFVCIGASYYIGVKRSSAKLDVSSDNKQRAERLKKEFGEVMNYSLSKALERKRL